jgi:hypothetical protein
MAAGIMCAVFFFACKKKESISPFGEGNGRMVFYSSAGYNQAILVTVDSQKIGSIYDRYHKEFNCIEDNDFTIPFINKSGEYHYHALPRIVSSNGMVRSAWRKEAVTPLT